MCTAPAMVAGGGKRLSLLGAGTTFDGWADAGEGDRGALYVAQALKTLTLKDSCTHCKPCFPCFQGSEVDLSSTPAFPVKRCISEMSGWASVHEDFGVGSGEDAWPIVTPL